MGSIERGRVSRDPYTFNQKDPRKLMAGRRSDQGSLHLNIAPLCWWRKSHVSNGHSVSFEEPCFILAFCQGGVSIQPLEPRHQNHQLRVVSDSNHFHLDAKEIPCPRGNLKTQQALKQALLGPVIQKHPSAPRESKLKPKIGTGWNHDVLKCQTSCNCGLCLVAPVSTLLAPLSCTV